MTERPTFRVIVASYRRPQGLATLLQALRPQVEPQPHRHLVVVNDGSHDAGYDAVLGDQHDWFDYRTLSENRGPAGARQHGATDASEDFLIFTDDDCEPPPGWLDRAEALVSTYPTADLFGGAGRVAAQADGRPMSAFQRVLQIRLRPAYFNNRLLCVPTAIMMVRRASFEAAGGFDEARRQGLRGG